MRTTCVATLIEGGHARNALPQLAAANVNCRVLPEDSVDYVQSTLQKVVADDQVSVKILGQPAPGPASALRPDVLAAVSRATEALWPGVPVVPIMVMGATDGKALRIAGIPTYGIQGISSIAMTSDFTAAMNAWASSPFTKAKRSSTNW